ncbi:MAG: ATP-binding protein [Gammaproteobacteria bacterium]|nr:ATP-binding protein [Gammaproteobacteria bacterium]
MDRRKLPIGIQTFRKLREDGCYYVDKTSHIKNLLDGGTHYFLSRPRRFGKSLFLDTLKELFEGSGELFEGLAIHGHWDWSVQHPVVRLDFSSGSFWSVDDLHAEVEDQLDVAAADAGIELAGRTGPIRFRRLIRELRRRAGQRVAVLVDEYDKPILDALEDADLARANRDYLRGLYSTLKSADAHIRFSFTTGVSRFSKVNLFSGLNNLTDITLDPGHSAICGYTEADLDETFAPELPGLDREAIRDWYNGYSWLGEERVYNPFDILLLFRSREFEPHWLETGTPTFLVDTLFRHRVPSVDLDRLLPSADLLSTFDVDAIAPEALLFQTGYLTILRRERRAGETFYRLSYPNREVRQGLNRSLLDRMVGDPSRRAAHGARLYDLLAAGEVEGMRDLFHAFYASIPHQWYTNNDIADYEGFYASVFYSYFAALGLDVTLEASTNRGRLDMAVRVEGRVYIFEFKVVEQAGEGAAMAQLVERGYAEKYRSPEVRVHLVGVEFSSESRNLVAFEHAAV